MVSALALAVLPLIPVTPQSPSPDAKRVLVIMNQNDPESMRIGSYYVAKREIPKANVVMLQTVTSEGITRYEFKKNVETPVREALAASKNPIDYLVLIRGVPLRVADTGHSVDSLLMSTGVKVEKLPVGKDQFDIANNPYYQSKEHFSHAKFGIYLACRIDGYTVEDAKALVDHSLAAKANKGPFLFDKAGNRKGGSYGDLQNTLDGAATALKAKGFRTTLDDDTAFAAADAPLAGYASWGSNDGAFDVKTYHALKFLPGAIAETYVSTSGRTFRPTTGGQSLIADLIAQGVTGVKGYVSEPYTLALAHSDILFDRYTSGFNLAESFYAASPVVFWKDVVIGDPLCAPYKS